VQERRCTVWAIPLALALAIALPAATGGAATGRTGELPANLRGVWHKTMTQKEWDRAGVYRTVGVYTAVIKKTGAVVIYLPNAYRAGCGSCASDFATTITTNAGHLTVGNVPACSFKGAYSWTASSRTLVLKPIADKRCPVREAFFGGRWKR
jgi:hypothetical protein